MSVISLPCRTIFSTRFFYFVTFSQKILIIRKINTNWMRLLFGLLFIFLSSTIASGQQGENRHHYAIEVSLDTALHTITGKSVISYYNNTDSDLRSIYMHLWANAYSNNSTPLVTQMLQMGFTDIYFQKKEERGRYLNINFSDLEKNNLNIAYQDDSNEILKLDLPKLLKAGERISIQCDFTIKIPELISRMGYSKEYYQICQWYPKVAKYDNQRWHTMPYLHLGEYFSDFADYEVKINLPAGFQAVATGTEAIEQSGYFTAQNVTDFAWFASSDLTIEEENITINGQSVFLQVAKHQKSESWDEAMDFLKRSVEFYTEEVGSYPYKEAKVVLSDAAGDSGMEYPTITIIGNTKEKEIVDHLIAHEVGHNWFYGAISSNERRYPWMDEGINSFYDHKYHKRYYNKFPYDNSVPQRLRDDDKDYTSSYSLVGSVLLNQMKAGKSEPSDLHSDDYSALNYGLSAYEKPAQAFNYLEDYLGEALFKECVKTYYQTYKFGHPSPQNMQDIFEEISNKNLDWFFHGFISKAGAMDYGITKIDKETSTITIENNGTIQAPVKISFFDNDKLVREEWIAGFSDEYAYKYELENFDNLKINRGHYTLDVNRRNDSYKTSGIFKYSKKKKLSLFGGIRNAEQSEIFYSPYFSANSHDGFSLGLGFYNSILPASKFKYFLAPAYATASQQVVGLAKVSYDILQQSGKFRKGVLSLSLKRYSYNSNEENDFDLQYTRVVPAFRLYLNSENKKRLTNYFQFRSINLFEDVASFSDTEISFSSEHSAIQELSYVRWSQDGFSPYRWDIALEQQSYKSFDDQNSSYVKLSSSFDYSYLYKKDKRFFFRMYGAYFLYNSMRESGNFSSRFSRGSIALMSQGFNDYRYDDFFVGRNNQSGFSSRQIANNQGGFKNALTSAFNIGQSNDFAIAMNLKMDMPFKILPFPVRPYLDLGYYSSKASVLDPFIGKFLYSGGFAIELGDGFMGIYIPVINSSDISNIYSTQTFLSRISFSFNLNKLDLWEVSENLNF